MYMFTYLYVRINVHMYVCTYVYNKCAACMWTYIHMYTEHMNIYPYAHVCIYIY